MAVETIRWSGELPGHVRLIEQTLLPERFEIVEIHDVPAMVDAIYRLAVRGAPAIGVAGAYGAVLGVQHAQTESVDEVLERLHASVKELAAARPTAVNLFWALDRMVARAERERAACDSGAALVRALWSEATDIDHGDRATCQLSRPISDAPLDGGPSPEAETQ